MVWPELTLPGDQGSFFAPRQFLDFRLAPAGAAAGMAIFVVNHTERAAAIEILRGYRW
jgi:hypothetical protein